MKHSIQHSVRLFLISAVIASPRLIADDGNHPSETLLISAVPDISSGLPHSSPAISEHADMQKLQAHKWIVKEVHRDGATTPAQIGQKVGDVLEFKAGGRGLEFG